jgi:drug/metabolite transporter (DMT)-like permease
MKNVLIGVLFAILWSSAAVATKFGVLSVPPLVLANARFFIAGFLLLVYAAIWGKNFRSPTKEEFRHLAVFGFFNTTLYLGLYVYAMKYTSAGIGSLAVSTNPLIILLMSSWLMGRKATLKEWLSICLGIAGVGVATLPLLDSEQTSIGGLALLTLSMIAVSYASVYYAKVKWRLSNILINGWQVTLGGIILLPFTIFLSDGSQLVLDTRFLLSVLWLSIAVSVVGLICWFHLLSIDALRASLWLFLCPAFGFIYAWWLMDEPITLYTYIGTAMVILGLYLVLKKDKIAKPVSQ